MILLIMSSCLQHRSPDSIHENPDAGHLDNDRNFDRDSIQNLSSDEKAVEKVNASTLRVTRISTATISVGGARFKKLIYVRDGASGYVEYEICAIKLGQCKSGKETANEMLIPIYVEDNVYIKLRACTDPGLSQNPEKNCGPWSDYEYKQYNPVGLTLQKKIETKSQLYQRMISYATPVSMVFSNFLSKRQECLRLDSWSGGWEDIMRTWLTSGPSIIGPSLAESDGSELLNTGGLSGHGIESSIPDSIRYKIDEVLEESNKSLIKMNNQNGSKYKVILDTGVHGLRVLYQQIYQFVISTESSCPLWVQTAKDLEIIEKKLMPIRSDYKSISDDIDKLLNQ